MGAQNPADDTPLDDPLAERLRRQRLVEESDFRAAQELFGAGGASSSAGGANSEQAQLQRRLESIVLPKALKDFEEIAQLTAKRYILPHSSAKHYKALLKSLLRAVCEPLSAEDSKEIETAASAVRADKVKADKAAAAARVAKGRRAVNAGSAGPGAGGGKSAGLDEYVYDDAGDGDDFDFM
jgi:translation initiation factor 3 subunit J